MATVLVVEDNEFNLDLATRRLKRLGYTTRVARNGQQAIEAVEASPPDIILMDLSLPVVTGWEAARVLKADERTAAIPIIALTAHAMSGDRERAVEAGCDDYETKPVNFRRLAEKLAAHLSCP